MTAIVMAAAEPSLILLGFPITDFAAGDAVTLTPVNPMSEHVNGGNNSVNIAPRIDSGVHDLKVRVLAGSTSDEYLNNQANQPSLTVFNGTLRRDYQKDGAARVESWTLENGSFTTRPTRTQNSQNSEASGVIEYTIRFRNAVRAN